MDKIKRFLSLNYLTLNDVKLSKAGTKVWYEQLTS